MEFSGNNELFLFIFWIFFMFCFLFLFFGLIWILFMATARDRCCSIFSGTLRESLQQNKSEWGTKRVFIGEIGEPRGYRLIENKKMIIIIIFERRNYPLILTMVALPPPYAWRQRKSNLYVMIGEMSIISSRDNIYISSVLGWARHIMKQDLQNWRVQE